MRVMQLVEDEEARTELLEAIMLIRQTHHRHKLPE